MPQIERHGAVTRYEVIGDAGPAVLLGHSLVCDGRMWEGIVPALAARYRVINIDARGHRASTAPRPFTLEDLAGDWLAILEQERLERAVLAGLSMGAMTAMRVALAAPDRVAALLLLDTSADPELPGKRVQYRLMAEIVKRAGYLAPITATVTRLLLGKTTLRERPDVVEKTRTRLQEHDPRALYHAVRAVADRKSITDDLVAVRAPTRVLVGAEDTATPRLRAERIVAKIPTAQLTVIPRAGHLSALEDPPAVARVMLEFLGGLAL